MDEQPPALATNSRAFSQPPWFPGIWDSVPCLSFLSALKRRHYWRDLWIVQLVLGGFFKVPTLQPRLCSCCGVGRRAGEGTSGIHRLSQTPVTLTGERGKAGPKLALELLWYLIPDEVFQPLWSSFSKCPSITARCIFNNKISPALLQNSSGFSLKIMSATVNLTTDTCQEDGSYIWKSQFLGLRPCT